VAGHRLLGVGAHRQDLHLEQGVLLEVAQLVVVVEGLRVADEEVLRLLPPADGVQAQALQSLGGMLPVEEPALLVANGSEVPGSSQSPSGSGDLTQVMLQLLGINVLRSDGRGCKDICFVIYIFR